MKSPHSVRRWENSKTRSSKPAKCRGLSPTSKTEQSKGVETAKPSAAPFAETELEHLTELLHRLGKSPSRRDAGLDAIFPSTNRCFAVTPRYRPGWMRLAVLQQCRCPSRLRWTLGEFQDAFDRTEEIVDEHWKAENAIHKGRDHPPCAMKHSIKFRLIWDRNSACICQRSRHWPSSVGRCSADDSSRHREPVVCL